MADNSKRNTALKIGFDAKRAFLNKTGLGNYSRSTIKILADSFPQNRYFFYTPKVGRLKMANFLFDLPNTKVCEAAQNINKSFWRSFLIKKDLLRDQIDLYHGLSQELPFFLHKTSIKTVVTIHDVIYLRYPQYFNLIDRSIYRWKAKSACESANQIIAVSEQTKLDLINYFKINPQKITVVYQGCAEIFKTEMSFDQKISIKKKYNLPDKFLLSVGTIEERKNLLLVCKALKTLPENIFLVVIGKQTNYAKIVKNYLLKEALQHRVLFLQDVAFADLPGIYQLASVFVYVSRYEGFGIPILEALNCKLPVIAAKGSCLEEAGGPDSVYVDPDDDAGLSKQILLILGDEQQRNKMITRGIAYTAKFDDAKIAQNIMQVYKKALANG